MSEADIDESEFRHELDVLVSKFLEVSSDPFAMRKILIEVGKYICSLPEDEDTPEEECYECDADALARYPLSSEVLDPVTHDAKTRQRWRFIIGSMDDFSSLEELIAAVAAVKEDEAPQGVGIYDFSTPINISPELATTLGQGYAFQNDWCADHTISQLIKID